MMISHMNMKVSTLQPIMHIYPDQELLHVFAGLFSTEMFAQQAVKTIKARDSSQPLFLMVSFQAPHNPFNRPPQRYYQHYE